jgi:ABC-type uncharacterized transport system substrate-binding protein
MRLIGLVLAVALTLAPLAAESQQARKIPRIGYLVLSPLADPPSAERAAFLEGLRGLGYVAGQNIIIEYRSAAWNRELLPDLAAELVEQKVDVIVAVPGAAEAARNATETIPIVVPAISSALEDKLVASLSRPGGNITGPGGQWELSGKRLELLKEAIPKLSRVALLWNPANQGALAEWRATQAAASVLRVTLQSLEVRNPSDVPKALSAMTQKQPDALITFLSALTTAYRPIIVEFAAKQRLPTIFPLKADVEAGGLISYSENLPDLFRRAAHYVDIKILKGAKPADLPVEQPTKFELVINLKTAKALGLTIPPSVLARADQVIE